MSELQEFLHSAVSDMPRVNDKLIIDSSKIKCFMDCPRKFFFEHVLGWRRESYRGDIHLIFGRAYHAAKEYLWLNGIVSENIKPAMKAFADIYREATEDQMEQGKYKNPLSALLALETYVKQFADDYVRYPVINTEFGGMMPLIGGQVITFRMDSIHHDQDGRILFMDDKTAGRTESNASIKYSMSFQMGTYTQALYYLYPKDDIWGGIVTEAVFLSKGVHFNRYPVRLDQAHRENWLGLAMFYGERIQDELFQLTECEAEDTYMRAFPQNTESCTKYYGCPFADFCVAWANPLKRVMDVPLGFKKEHWNPLSKMEEEGVKPVLIGEHSDD